MHVVKRRMQHVQHAMHRAKQATHAVRRPIPGVDRSMHLVDQSLHRVDRSMHAVKRPRRAAGRPKRRAGSNTMARRLAAWPRRTAIHPQIRGPSGPPENPGAATTIGNMGRRSPRREYSDGDDLAKINGVDRSVAYRILKGDRGLTDARRNLRDRRGKWRLPLNEGEEPQMGFRQKRNLTPVAPAHRLRFWVGVCSSQTRPAIPAGAELGGVA